jgi:hypothetical protein
VSTETSVAVSPAPEPQPKLSEMSRLVNVFIAPSATFTDIRRSASWWVPWLLMSILQLAFAFAIDQKFGWDTLTEQQIAKNPSVQARLDGLKPEQREQILQTQSKVARYLAYAAPVRILIIWVIIAAIFLAVFKFGFGAEIPLKQSLATWAYATMPLLISFLLTIVSIYATSAGNFDLNNPVASNLGYFLDPKNSRLLYWLGSCLDVFDIWSIVLLGIGYSIVSNNKVKRTSAMAVFAVVLVLMKGVGALRA